MMKLLGLPSEILCEIITLCGPGAITETCRAIADIAASTPALWTSIHLGSPQFTPEGRERLRTRLRRVANHPLTVSVGPVKDNGAKIPDIFPGGIIGDLCTILSEWNAQIGHLQITSETTVGAGIILRIIFHDLTPSVVIPTLQSLSICVECDFDFYSDCLRPMDFMLPSVLASSHHNFPCLQSLSIPNLFDCLPSFPQNATFSQLRVLVLDGAHVIEEFTGICKVTELLSNTPQLETLWLKHECSMINDDALNPVPNWEAYNGEVPLRVSLPHLVRLAITNPGTGTDLLFCLEAPSLEDLHLDGSNPDEPLYDDSLFLALKSFASRSSGLHRIAFNQTTLGRIQFEWLLFGDEGRPPFPQLEALAFHGYANSFGFEDIFLLQFAQQPTLPLRRLVLQHCPFSFTGSCLVQVYQKLIQANTKNKRHELVIDWPSVQIADEDLAALEEIGVKVIRRDKEEARMSKWWTLGHNVDASDSHAY